MSPSPDRPRGGRHEAASESSMRRRGRPGRRFRPFHFYIALALFDVLVIVASIYVQHETLQSFDRALQDVHEIHARDRWLEDLRSTLIRINAPGNDVFTTRDPHSERSKFIKAQIEMRRLLDEPPPDTPAPRNYSQHLDAMTQEARSIFDIFDRIAAGGVAPETERQEMAEASRHMASMDRAQARALEVLGEENARLISAQDSALGTHEAVLKGRSRIEFIFVMIVGVILAGVTWYWRQLQRMDEALFAEQQRAESEKRNRLASIGEVCFSVAHGIRNPVAAIASSAQLALEYGQTDDRTRQRLHDVVTSCRGLTERVTKLLSFAREGRTETEQFTPDEILEQAVAEVAHKLDAHGLSVERRFRADGMSIQGDRNILVQAVIEMLSNALDELKQGGRVTLVSERAVDGSGMVELGVIDDGPGFEPDEVERACELFYTDKAGGSGIGLASIRRAAELHGGTVVIADAIPHGADVRIRIPCGRE